MRRVQCVVVESSSVAVAVRSRPAAAAADTGEQSIELKDMP